MIRELPTKRYKFTSTYACSATKACTSVAAAILEAERMLFKRGNFAEVITVSDDNSGSDLGAAAWLRVGGVRIPQYKVVVTLC